MEVISSGWIYIAANGMSGAVGESVLILAEVQGNIREEGRGEKKHTRARIRSNTKLPIT